MYCASCDREVPAVCKDSDTCFSYADYRNNIQQPVAAASEAGAPALEAILSERGSRYGRFQDNSRISQSLKNYWRDELVKRIERGQEPLAAHHLEALDMIATKICRIFAGDPNYPDNWDDIAGYAQLGKTPR